MLAQRTTQQALRRIAVSKPSMLSQMAMKQFAAPATTASFRQIRPATTQKLTPADSYKILVAQRKNRPTSPHLTIYRPQITSTLSALNRITGATLSGGFYVFGAAYLIAPLVGWHLESASMAAAFATWPVALKVATKFAIAMPFTFHSINGVRHLVWDTGRMIVNRSIIRTGWAVVGLSTASALALATLY